MKLESSIVKSPKTTFPSLMKLPAISAYMAPPSLLEETLLNVEFFINTDVGFEYLPFVLSVIAIPLMAMAPPVILDLKLLNWQFFTVNSNPLKYMAAP